jgi:hypothetical protein
MIQHLRAMPPASTVESRRRLHLAPPYDARRPDREADAAASFALSIESAVHGIAGTVNLWTGNTLIPCSLGYDISV